MKLENQKIKIPKSLLQLEMRNSRNKSNRELSEDFLLKEISKNEVDVKFLREYCKKRSLKTEAMRAKVWPLILQIPLIPKEENPFSE